MLAERPPDRYPPRLATLTPEQEAVVIAFLESLALGDGTSHLRDDAPQAREEWWLPGARHRPRLEDVAALRSAPVSYHVVERARYRLVLPAALTSSGARHIAEESRTVEVWRGTLCMIVAAVSGQEVVLLTVRSWPRDNVEAAMERIVSTFEIVARR